MACLTSRKWPRSWHPSGVQILLTPFRGSALALRPPATVWQPSGLRREICHTPRKHCACAPTPPEKKSLFCKKRLSVPGRGLLLFHNQRRLDALKKSFGKTRRSATLNGLFDLAEVASVLAPLRGANPSHAFPGVCAALRPPATVW